MQPPRSREMQTSGQIGIPELGQNGGHHHHQLQQIQNGGAGMQSHFDHAAAGGGHDDFFDQMLSTLPSAWADLGNPKSPWGDLTGSADAAAGQKLFSIGLAGKSAGEEGEEGGGLQYAPYDESTLLASRLRQHQISGGGGGGGGGSQGGKGMIQLNPHHAAQQQMLLQGGVDSGLVPLPLSLGSNEGDGLFNGFSASMQQQQQHFHHAQIPGGGGGGAPAGGAVAGGGGAAAPPRQRVRARRGQATDPHSIAERLRRERIAERMRALQELVPNANKTDKASMLDEIIEYVRFLQLQVKVLSMSRLGGAAAVAPLVADISPEGGRPAAAGGDNLAVAEHQVAKLMEEDMGSAMQYLQGKGLCLMPISLASAISSATRRPRVGGILAMQGNGDAPSSPSMSVLTVQSAMANGGGGDAGGNSNKDAASVSKP